VKIALVTWMDAVRTDDIVNADGLIGVTRKTVGWVVRKDKTGIVLAFSFDADSVFERGFFIPQAYVKKVVWLADIQGANK
jgi:hypothetical protein